MRAVAWVTVAVALTMAGCAADRPAAVGPGEGSTADSNLETWWANLHGLCGKAFAGALAHGDEIDADFAATTMAMWVRRCDENRVEIPFYVGEDRSRTWVLTRTALGVQLQHDHRHQDGSADQVTMYGGRTDGSGTAVAQFFPADEYSRDLFLAHGLPQSVTNIWSMEVDPGIRFSYVLRRTDRHFQVDFDLTTPIEPPPPPWGHE